MDAYSIIGRVINAQRAPVAGVRIEVRHRSELQRSPKVVAKTMTDAGGRFDVSLERRELRRQLGSLGRKPRISLALHDPGGSLLYATRESPIEWQLEFRVFLGSSKPVADAPDVYSGTIRRMMAGTRESGVAGQAMKSMGGGRDAPKTGKTGAWTQVAGILQQSSELGDSVNLAFAALDGVVSHAIDSSPVRLVGYDGAQVPRRSWPVSDHQAIIWPRKEPFRWA